MTQRPDSELVAELLTALANTLSASYYGDDDAHTIVDGLERVVCGVFDVDLSADVKSLINELVERVTVTAPEKP